MSYLDNGVVKVGVDLDRGGMIVYPAPSSADPAREPRRRVDARRRDPALVQGRQRPVQEPGAALREQSVEPERRRRRLRAPELHLPVRLVERRHDDPHRHLPRAVGAQRPGLQLRDRSVDHAGRLRRSHSGAADGAELGQRAVLSRAARPAAAGHPSRVEAEPSLRLHRWGAEYGVARSPSSRPARRGAT